MADLDLRLVRYFIAVAEQASFTDAAAALHISQPALSQAIRRLEHDVGTRLIDRGTSGSRRGIGLTHAGAVFLPAARNVLSAAERAVRAARETIEPIRLHVGFGTSTPRKLTRAALQAGESLDHVDVSLEYIPWGQELASLADDRVDMVFLQAPPGFTDAEFKVAALGPVHRMAVFHAQHELATRSEVSMRDLAEEPIIDAASDRAYWIVDPRPDQSTPHTVGPPARTVDEMLTLVSTGKGMAITSSTVAATNRSDELAFIPITDLDAAVLYLVTRADDRRPEVIAVRDRVVTSSDVMESQRDVTS
jgi:DNA-binding transcriptional LysR family regulator